MPQIYTLPHSLLQVLANSFDAMNQPIIAVIARDDHFSPNMVTNDAAILNETVSHLREAGCSIRSYTEAEFLNQTISEQLIVSMARGEDTLQKLCQLEDAGAIVINSGYGVKNCIREPMTRALLNAQLPHPASLLIDTDLYATAELSNPLFAKSWIKRGDSHAVIAADVSYAESELQLRETLHQFAQRGIKRVIINAHLPGDLVKFYGVANTEFFYWFYPDRLGYSKFGLEQINGSTQHIPFNSAELHAVCNKAAETLGVTIYGGDCVVSVCGEVQLIDFNDWPSFSPCRAQAAPFIAKSILSEIESAL